MQTIHLSTIDTTTLTIETDYRDRDRYSRILYHDEANHRFIKIWNDDYFYKFYFSAALQAGFYADIAIITDLIIQPDSLEGLYDVRGYATQQGKPVNHQDLDKAKFIDLVDRVAAACRKHKMVYIDLHVNNVVEIDDRYYIIDLEPVIPVNDLVEIPGLGKILQFNHYGYRKKIAELIGEYELQPLMVRQHTHNEKDINYGTANGRVYLEKEFLPTLSGRVLFIGVSYYTDFYCNLVQQPELFETLDVIEEVIDDGSPHGHYVCNIMDFTLAAEQPLYDHVVFFGILGHTDSSWEIIETSEAIMRCIEKVAMLVHPGGTLLLGPSTQNRTEEYWLNLYNSPLLENYEVLTCRKIDINYIWHGKRIL